MLLENERDLSSHIKAGQFLPLYLLYGQESFLVDGYAAKLCAPIKKAPMSQFNYMSFEGREGVNVDALADACEALPLMAERKCVLVDDLDPEKLGATDFSKLEQLLSDPPESCILIITLKSSSPNAKEKGKAKTAKLIKLCEKKGCVARLDRRSRSDTIKFIRDRAASKGCELDSNTASALMESCNGDLLMLCNEVDKLCAYVDSGTITKKDVEAVATVSIDAGIFDLSSAILRGDYQKAMEVISDLIYLRESPVTILSALSMSFVDIYRAKQSKKARISANEAMKELGYFGGSTYRFTKALGQADRFSDNFLAGALGTLAEADLKLKSTKVEDRILLEQTVTQLFVLMQQEVGR